MPDARTSDAPEAGPASPALDGRDASGLDRFRALSEATFEAIVLSEDGVIFDANPAALALFGFEDVQDLQGRHAADLVAPEDADRVRAFTRQNHAEPYETVVVRADGRRVPVEVRGQPLAYRGRTARVTALRDITERKRVEEALRREKAFVQFLQEVAVAANEAANIEDVLQFALDRVCAFTGWPVGHAYLTERRDGILRLVPSGLWHFDVPERFARFRQVTEQATFGRGEGLPGRVLSTGRPAWVVDVTADSQFTRANLVEHLGVRAGFAFPILVEDTVEAVLEFYAEAATPPDEALLEAMSRAGHQLGHVIDRKRVAERLRTSEERYRTLTQSAVVAIVTADAEGIIRDWNRQAEHVFGYAREEILGRSVEVIMPRRHVDAHRAGMQRMREGGARHVIGSTVELHGVRQGGEEFPIELSLSEWQAGGRTFITAFIQDITERKRTEEALRRSEAQNRAILDALPDALTRLDADGTYLEVRLPPGYESVRDPRQLVGMRLEETLPPDLAERALRCIRKALEDDAVQTFEYEVEIQGTRYVREARVVPYGEGEVLSVQRDITDRKRTEREYAALNRRLQLILNSVGEGIYGLDAEGRTTFVNEAAARMLGYTPEELIGRPQHAVIHYAHADGTPYPREACPIYAAFADGTVHHVSDEVFWRKDGTAFQVEYVSTPILEEGTLRGAVVAFRDVTEQRRAEAAIRESARQLARAQEIAHLGSWEWDVQTGALAWSDELYRIYGFDPEGEPITFERFVEALHPGDRDALLAIVGRARETGEPYSLHHRIIRPDGEVRILRGDGEAARASDGTVVKLYGTAHDVTESRRQQEALEASQALLDGILSGSLDGIAAFEVVRDDAGAVVDFAWLLANPAAAAMVRQDPETLPGRRMLEVNPGLREAGIFDRYVAVVETGEPYHNELHYDAEGIEGWFSVTAVKLGDGLAVTFQDISERKRSEQRLAESEDLLNRAQRIARIGSWEWDVQTGALTWSDELYRIFGVDPDEEPITFDSYIGRIVGDDRARVQALIQEALDSRKPFSFYHTITRADGEERILRGDGDVVLDEQEGTVLRMYGTAHDVTERRRAEERLRLLEAASSASVDGITIADMTTEDEALVYVSPGFERMTGYPVEEAMGRNCRFLQGDDTGQAAIREIRDAMTEGRQTRVTLRNYRKDGTLFWNELTLYPLHDATGALTHYVGIQRDVTERRQAQEQLERINRKLEQRNRELQDFAYVASHDLQEPLRKIRAFADLMREDYGATIDEAGRYYLERMQDAATRMSDLIADLLAYSRVTTRAKPFERVDLDRIVAEVLSDLEIQISEVEGTVDVEPLPLLEADPTQMRQVLQNLIGNGLKFHREGERPVVRVWAEIDEGTGYEGDAPRRARIYVRDNGIGFKEKYLDRIFTPFQRLHSRGEYKGTGMGLAICRRIAERHQGTITARSAPGEGATFELTLPLRQPEPQPDPDPT